MKTLTKVVSGIVFAVLGASAQAGNINVDIVTVVDESGSMFTEHAWLGPMITALNTAMNTEATDLPDPGVLSANYGLTGFGCSGTTHTGCGAGTSPHKHSVGGGDLGTAAQYNTATGTLATSGFFEDGWAATTYALDNYAWTANHATNIILVTDEDRDNSDATITYNTTLAALNREKALLNAVVNCNIKDSTGATALGVDSDGNAYKADGSGGFTKVAGGYSIGTCAGTTNADYVNLALATGGAAWDLNQLRAGGNTATSFTAAFVDIKVTEIIDQQQDLPTPGTLGLLGLGFLGLRLARRKSA